jgi:hypothetical protein
MKKNKQKKHIGKLLLTLGISIAIWGSLGKSDSYLRARSVMLMGANALCSGEQIHTTYGNDYILSAGHCAELAVNGSIEVITESGKHLQRRVIAEDKNSDLLLIEGLPNLRGLDIAKSDHRFEHVRTFTHGSGLKTYMTEGELVQDQHLDIPLRLIEGDEDEAKCNLPKEKIKSMQVMFWNLKICALSVEETITTALIIPGSSGGMVVNDRGDLLGVCSASASPFGALVRLKDIKAFVNAY